MSNSDWSSSLNRNFIAYFGQHCALALKDVSIVIMDRGTNVVYIGIIAGLGILSVGESDGLLANECSQINIQAELPPPDIFACWMRFAAY